MGSERITVPVCLRFAFFRTMWFPRFRPKQGPRPNCWRRVRARRAHSMRRNGTRGCRATPPRMGSPELLRVLHSNGLATPYRVSVPAGYQPHTAWPLLLALHGWGMPYESESGWHQHGRAHGYVVVTPQGFSDGGLGPSWNGAGSVGSPGAGGATCTRPHAAAGFCYPSCGKCGDGCWWTTCLDSVGQVAALLDEVMGDWCAHRCPLPAAAAAATAAAAAAAAAVYASGLACNPMSWSHPGASRAAPSTPLVSPTGADSSSSSPEISAPPAGSRPTSRRTVRPCPAPASAHCHA